MAKAESNSLVRTERDLVNLSTQVTIFKALHGRLPTAEEGLEILVENKTGIPNWRRLLSEHVSDSWGTPYQYVIRPKLRAHLRKPGRTIWSSGYSRSVQIE